MVNALRNEGRVNNLRYAKHKYTYPNKNYPLLGLPKELDFSTNVDIEIIGSDEVFNAVQSNPDVGYTRDLFGHNSKATKIASYAASFGNTTVDKLRQYQIAKDVAEDLLNFDHISVRDQNSANIVAELTGRTPRINIDPALAFDYRKDEPKIPSQQLFSGKYVIAYGYASRFSEAENRAVAEYARSIGATIFGFGGMQDCVDRFIDCSPFELLAYFRDAEAIITDTFHGTIFSIINEKNFATIIRPSVGQHYGNEEKLDYLLATFNLSNRRAYDGKIASILDTEITYPAVNEILAEERVRTREYLMEVLS